MTWQADEKVLWRARRGIRHGEEILYVDGANGQGVDLIHQAELHLPALPSLQAVLLSCCPCRGLSILSEVTPPTGEQDAGDPPVRFGGRGSVLALPTPIGVAFFVQNQRIPHPTAAAGPPSVAAATEGCCQLIFRRQTRMYKLQRRVLKPRPSEALNGVFLQPVKPAKVMP